MIPVEIQENLPRFQNFIVEESNKERKVNLDLLDEVSVEPSGVQCFEESKSFEG